MKMNHFYILLFTLSYVQVVHGQEENHLFLFDGQFQRANPSVLGLKKESYLGLLIDSQWLGIKDAPKQQSIFYDSYKDTQNLNLGGVIRNRSRFGEQNIQLLLQSSYPLQLRAETFIHLGFQLVGDFFSSEYNYLRSVDGVVNDPLFQQQRRFIPNVGIGFILIRNKFWVQAAVPRLLDQYLIKKSPTIFLRNKLHFFGGVGTELKTNQDAYTIKLGGYVYNLAHDKLTVQLKATLGLRIGEVLFGMNSAKNMGIGFQLNQRNFLSLGYFFQFPYLSSTELNKTNHSLSLLFNLSPKNIN